MVALRPRIPTVILLAGSLTLGTTMPLSAQTAQNKGADVRREWGKAVGGQAISIATDKAAYLPEEPIVLDVILKNVGKQQAHVVDALCMDMFMYRLDVRFPDGQEVPMTRFGKKALDQASDGFKRSFKLEPGGEQRIQYALSRLFDLSVSGKYTVSARRTIFLASGSKKGSSNSLEFTVKEKGGPCWRQEKDMR